MIRIKLDPNPQDGGAAVAELTPAQKALQGTPTPSDPAAAAKLAADTATKTAADAKAVTDAAAAKTAADTVALKTQAEADQKAGKTLTPEQIAVLKGGETTSVPPNAQSNIVPDKYEIKLPDGSPLDPAIVQEVETYAKANKLTNEQAQAVLNRDSATVANFIKSGQEKLKSDAGKFVTELKADPEIGGENFTRSVEVAKRVVDSFATPKLKQILNETGLGNHPEIVRVFAKIGLNMSEDRFVQAGSATVKTERSAADRLFGNKKKG